MVKRSQRLRLLDMAEQIDAIEAAMIGRNLTDLQSNWMLRHAVERGMAQHPEVPWRRVADTGNWLRHGCDKVEPTLILSIVLDHFPALGLAVSAMLATTPED